MDLDAISLAQRTVLLVGVGILGGLACLWIHGKNRKWTDEPKNWGGNDGVLFLAPLVVLLSVLSLYVATLRPILQMVAARGWQEVPCLIVASDVQQTIHGYRVNLEYLYEYRGRVFTGAQHGFIDLHRTGDYEEKSEIVQKYPAGAETFCYMDPLEPGKSVLNRGVNASLWWGSLPFLLMAGALTRIAFDLFPQHRVQRGEKTKSGPVGIRVALDVEAPVQPGRNPAAASGRKIPSPEPLILGPKNSRLFQCLAAGFAMLFWNGLLTVFLHRLVSGVYLGEPELGLAVFLSPFLVTGAALIFLFVNKAVYLWQQLPRLVIHAHPVPAGGVLDLEWHYRVFWRPLPHQFRICLELCKQMRRPGWRLRRWSWTVLKSVVLTEGKGVEKDAGGRLHFPISPGSFCTHREDDLRIAWHLKVESARKYWPALSQRYEIEVVPPLQVGRARSLQEGVQSSF